LHDNGNFRASPFDGSEPVDDDLNYTRAVEYEIDEDAMTVRQVWEYGGTSSERIYSGSRGDADWMLETGNVLIVLSSIGYVGGVAARILDSAQSMYA
jgi:arylsulfate sulfotransferase